MTLHHDEEQLLCPFFSVVVVVVECLCSYLVLFVNPLTYILKHI